MSCHRSSVGPFETQLFNYYFLFFCICLREVLKKKKKKSFILLKVIKVKNSTDIS